MLSFKGCSSQTQVDSKGEGTHLGLLLQKLLFPTDVATIAAMKDRTSKFSFPLMHSSAEKLAAQHMQPSHSPPNPNPAHHFASTSFLRAGIASDAITLAPTAA